MKKERSERGERHDGEESKLGCLKGAVRLTQQMLMSTYCVRMLPQVYTRETQALHQPLPPPAAHVASMRQCWQLLSPWALWSDSLGFE